MKLVSLFIGLIMGFCNMAAWADTDTTSLQPAVSTSSFTSTQKTAIEQIVHDYLVAHPEVLMEAQQALQLKQVAQMQAQAMTAIVKNKQQLFNNASNPVGGNPNGKITVVEFFDYQCGHCKAMEPTMDALLTKDNNIKVIYKQLPIFGDNSEYAAKAALAAAKQGKFAAFHKALFAAQGGLNSDSVMKIAQSVGLDTAQLTKDMQDPTIAQQIKDNFQLAQSLQLVGTPTFVLANQGLTQFDFIPGATSQQDLQQRIDKLASGKTSTSAGANANAKQ